MSALPNPQEIGQQVSLNRTLFSGLQKTTGSIWKGGKGRVRLPRLYFPPRISLLTGSILILLTLYLPTAVDSCGSPRLGTGLASGVDDIQWPGIALSVVGKGRPFYLFCLALAAVTLLLSFASVVHRDLIRKHNLLTWMVAISGSVALVSSTDLYPAAFILRFWDMAGTRTQVAFVVLFLLLPIACLRPEFWTRKGAIFWTLVATDIFLIMQVGAYLVDKSYPESYVDSNITGQIFFSYVSILLVLSVSLLPLSLWLRYILFHNRPSRHWPDVGRRLAILYSATLTFDLFCIVHFRFWGLIAFFLGAYLIFYGYWQLRQEAVLQVTSLVESCDT